MNLIRSILSFFLASIVLSASIGVTINLHLCCGRVQSMALFSKARPCKGDVRPCYGPEHHGKKKACCEEKSIVFMGKEPYAEVKFTKELTPSLNLVAVVLPFLYSIICSDSTVEVPQYAHYKPPLPEQDITILVQTFLI